MGNTWDLCNVVGYMGAWEGCLDSIEQTIMDAVSWLGCQIDKRTGKTTVMVDSDGDGRTRLRRVHVGSMSRRDYRGLG